MQRMAKMTVVELRGALMRDFGVDAEMRGRVEERYRKGMGRRSSVGGDSGGDGGGGGGEGKGKGKGKRKEKGGEAGKGYFEGLAWKVVLSYLEEIEGEL